MIGKLLKVAAAGVCIFIVSATALKADETAEKKHAVVGERAAPVEERMDQRHARAVALKNADKEEARDLDAKTLAKGVRSSAKSLARGVYYTTHPGAYQHAAGISVFGDTVELTDGSIWVVQPKYAYKTLNWYPADLIVITPNHSWFSSYDFKLTNQSTGVSVPVNLYLGPFDPSSNSPWTHWIVAIDYYYNDVYLEDGSAWSMSSFDRNIVDQWIVGDVVIIGVNDGLMSGANPNILINVNLLNFAACYGEY